MTRIFCILVFIAGLIPACWIGAGYIGSNPLALAVTVLIVTVYLAGALELYRYQQATDGLRRALEKLSEPLADLESWLSGFGAGLRNAVRLRIEGERVGLPGPALTPYLVGLLVLLGMFGTFLGMVATLRGTGLALEGATDLHAIRASLAAPVKGLGFAFGTSIAGVAGSAMLGLLSALCRRERVLAAQLLDAKVASTLRVHSLGHQREERIRLLQRQADAMPVVADRLETMMAELARQNQALNERLVASQEAFHAKAEAVYERLAVSVEQSLKDGIADGARAAGTAIQPVVEATMSNLARESTALNDSIAQAVRSQLEGMSSRAEKTASAVTDGWHAALADHRRMNESLFQGLRTSLDGFTETFGQRATGLLDNVSERLDGVSERVERSAEAVAQSWNTALAAQRDANQALAQDLRVSLEGLSESFDRRASTLVDDVSERLSGVSTLAEGTAAAVAQAWNTALADSRQMNEALVNDLRASLDGYTLALDKRTSTLLDGVSERLDGVSARAENVVTGLAGNWSTTLAENREAHQSLVQDLRGTLDGFTQAFGQHATGLMDGVATRLDGMTDTLSQAWGDGLVRYERSSEQQASHNRQVLADTVAAFEEHSASLLKAVETSHGELRSGLASQEEQRLAAWAGALGKLASELRQEWEAAGAQTIERQREICAALAQTANEISTGMQTHSASTIAEIEKLVQAASEAPRAAADVVTEVRQKLSDSLARDNAMLEERSRLLETVGTLLDAVNHSSSEQRTAVDALVTTSADVLDRVRTQFTDIIQAETGRLAEAAGQLTGSAVEMASLGEGFGAAVQQFGQSNAALVEQLQRIESALDKSATRGDEQLAYYVAQAREVVDLSIMSQKQIIEELRQLASQQAASGAEAS